MQFRLTIIVIVLLSGAVALAGCTGTGTSPVTNPGTVTPTGSTAPGSVSPVSTLTVGPTDIVPSYNMVTVDVGVKDYLGIIPVIFQGGQGMIHVKKIDVKLTRTDGSTQTTTLGTNKGDEVDLQGTRGELSATGQIDRVEVWVSMDNGDKYKTNDALREYRTR
jgi:hypothetical protein